MKHGRRSRVLAPQGGCESSRNRVHDYINDRHRTSPRGEQVDAIVHVVTCDHKRCRKTASRLRVELPEVYTSARNALEAPVPA